MADKKCVEKSAVSGLVPLVRILYKQLALGKLSETIRKEYQARV
jgi:hypothetical protein